MSIGTPTFRNTARTKPAVGPRYPSPAFRPPTQRPANTNRPVPPTVRRPRRLPRFLRGWRAAEALVGVLQPGFVPYHPVRPVIPPGYVLQAEQSPPASPRPTEWPWEGLHWFNGSTPYGPWSSTPFVGASIGPTNTILNNPLVDIPYTDAGAILNRLSLWNRRRNVNPAGYWSIWPQYYIYRPNSGVPLATYPDFFPFIWSEPVWEPAPLVRPRYQFVPNIPLAPARHIGDLGLSIRPGSVAVTNPRGRPPRGVTERKFRMSAAMFGAIVAVNAAGEMIEWVDILAGLAGYPFGRWRNYRSPWMDKAYWLFVEGGLSFVEGDEFIKAAVLNQVEDMFYGGLGRMSKSAARNFNRQVGFQTGLAL